MDEHVPRRRRSRHRASSPDSPLIVHEPRPRRHVELPKIKALTYGRCLGSGHFSHVYEGTYRSEPAAIKVIERGNEHTVEQEVALLQRLRGIRHVVQLREVINIDSTLLIFELLPGITVETFYEQLTIARLRGVLQSLLLALRDAHRIGIVHRDVKLGNIMVSPDWRDVHLIDWGCGCNVSHSMSPRAGSRPIRSIEMLLQDQDYGTAADMWAVGVFIFTTLCAGENPWRCRTGWETLVQIAAFVGRRATMTLAKHYRTDLPPKVAVNIWTVPKKRFAECFAPQMNKLVVPELIDLMERLFELKKEDRMTAEQAMHHPFFTAEWPE
jgi:serine/threonine protein kinase